MGVVIPNSQGLRGIEAAATLGACAKPTDGPLEILNHIDQEQREKTNQLLKSGFCTTHLQEGLGSLYIEVRVTAGADSARVIIKEEHSNLVLVEKNGQVQYKKAEGLLHGGQEDQAISLSVKEIFDFVNEVDLDELKPILKPQLDDNTAIANEGILNNYGAAIGKILIENYGSDIKIRAKAMAAAGCDARMGGSALPVIINSGSGNQGITVTVPVAEYARELNSGEEKLYRALALSNLISIHIKRHIGKLSAFCGAVTAACGSGAAITYLYGGQYGAICSTISNTLANVGGIVCDGAKASCAAKIASSVDAAIMGHEMTGNQTSFSGGEGIVNEDIEQTIANMGQIAREGMRETDIEIMQLMIGIKEPNL